jgi:hypothetical protein
MIRGWGVGSTVVAAAASISPRISIGYGSPGVIASSAIQMVVCAVAVGLEVLGAAVTISAAVTGLTHARNMDRVQQFITTSLTLDHGSTEAVRLIQDLELLSRGYSIPTRADLVPISRIEGDGHTNANGRSERLLEPLRLVVYRHIRSCLYETRRATVQLMVTRPLTEGLDYSSLYICTSSLAAIGLSDGDTDAEILEQTNSLSLKSIKRLLLVFRQQRSEYLRRLSISLLIECELEGLAADSDEQRPHLIAHKTAHETFLDFAPELRRHIDVHESGLNGLARQLAFHAHFFDDGGEDNNRAPWGGQSRANRPTAANPTVAELQVLMHQLGRGASAAALAAQQCLAISRDGRRQRDAAWCPPQTRIAGQLKTTREALEQALVSLTMSEGCVASMYRSGATGDSADHEHSGHPDSAKETMIHGRPQRQYEEDPALAEHAAMPPGRDLVFEIETGPEVDVDEGLSPEDRRKRRAAARAHREAEERVYQEARERRLAHMRELCNVLVDVRTEATKRELPIQPRGSLGLSRAPTEE